MSVIIASPDAQCYQPFQCNVCQVRFTRHENLKRHASLHTGSQAKPSFPCELCPITFSRRDLRNRHVKRKHPEQEGRRACKRRRRDATAATAETSGDGLSDIESASATSKIGEMESLPEQWDAGIGLDMLSSEGWNSEWMGGQIEVQLQNAQLQLHQPQTENLGIVDTAARRQDEQISEQTGSHDPPTDGSVSSSYRLESRAQAFSGTTLQGSSPRSNIETTAFTQRLPDGLSPSDLPYIQEDWHPTAFQIAQGVDLFFTHVSHFVPFLHLPTFDPTLSAEHLVLSMLCLAYQHGEDPEAGEDAGTGDELSQHCFHRARVLVASKADQEDDPTDHLAVVQTYLLLEIAAMTYLCGRDSAYGLKAHSKMIALARSSGLTQPNLPPSAPAADLDALWRAFAAAESHKRTMFAVHRIDALWYQLLSVPRSLSHLEIKHELPCPEDRWAAVSAAHWAHRQLLLLPPGAAPPPPPQQYADAVRRFLSSDAAVASLPPCDSYGAISIAQFLLSSAREVSGWSAMTGRLSLERLETLKASLAALGTFVQPEEEGGVDGSPKASRRRAAASSVESRATWQMAMIELRIWSSTHTGGVVQGSVDGALEQLTALAASSELSYGGETAQATRPHIDWFLRYLDDELAPDSEAPWVTLYAYKAFLIAWQLVRANIPGVMQVVGVDDGDVDGAVSWARGVFRRREPRRLGKLIVTYLDMLVS